MATILLFALAAAVYSQLLAVVVVILTRPEPKPLLWTCYLGSLVVGVGCGIALVAIFRSRGSVAGTSANALGPSAFIAVGAIAVALAIFVATRPGREVFGRYLPRLRRRDSNDEEALGTVTGVTSRVHQVVNRGSLVFAALAGAILAVPGLFDLLAFGRLARSGDATIELGAVIVVFVLIKFLLIEVPIVGYAISSVHRHAALPPRRARQGLKDYGASRCPPFVWLGSTAHCQVIAVVRGLGNRADWLRPCSPHREIRWDGDQPLRRCSPGRGLRTRASRCGAGHVRRPVQAARAALEPSHRLGRRHESMMEALDVVIASRSDLRL